VRSVLLHGHIFKNAGSTLDWSLQRQFGDNFIDHRRDDLMRSRGGDYVAEMVQEDSAIKAISSHHMPRVIPPVRGVRFVQVYLLRHPIKRIRSVYDFERKQQAETPGAIAAKKMDFREYVDWRMQRNVAPTIRNFQSRYLAGRFPPLHEKMTELEYFSLALETLHEIPFIGIVEQYDETMVMLEDLLEPHFPGIDLAHVPQNVTRRGLKPAGKSRNVSDILASLGSLQERVIEQNSFDLALYEAASALFQQRTDDVNRFQDKLKRFKERCRALHKR
jgi:hypothetical protein